jgi:hypothetical protein
MLVDAVERVGPECVGVTVGGKRGTIEMGQEP